jgi:hypothetical protein
MALEKHQPVISFNRAAERTPERSEAASAERAARH